MLFHNRTYAENLTAELYNYIVQCYRFSRSVNIEEGTWRMTMRHGVETETNTNNKLRDFTWTKPNMSQDILELVITYSTKYLFG